MLLHGNSGYANVSQRYVIRTLAVCCASVLQPISTRRTYVPFLDTFIMGNKCIFPNPHIRFAFLVYACSSYPNWLAVILYGECVSGEVSFNVILLFIRSYYSEELFGSLSLYIMNLAPYSGQRLFLTSCVLPVAGRLRGCSHVSQ